MNRLALGTMIRSAAAIIDDLIRFASDGSPVATINISRPS